MPRMAPAVTPKSKPKLHELRLANAARRATYQSPRMAAPKEVGWCLQTATERPRSGSLFLFLIGTKYAVGGKSAHGLSRGFDDTQQEECPKTEGPDSAQREPGGRCS